MTEKRDLQEVFDTLVSYATEHLKTIPSINIEDAALCLEEGETYATKKYEGPKHVLTAFKTISEENVSKHITKRLRNAVITEIDIGELEPMLEILRKYQQPGGYKPTILVDEED